MSYCPCSFWKLYTVWRHVYFFYTMSANFFSTFRNDKCHRHALSPKWLDGLNESWENAEQHYQWGLNHHRQAAQMHRRVGGGGVDAQRMGFALRIHRFMHRIHMQALMSSHHISTCTLWHTPPVCIRDPTCTDCISHAWILRCKTDKQGCSLPVHLFCAMAFYLHLNKVINDHTDTQTLLYCTQCTLLYTPPTPFLWHW